MGDVEAEPGSGERTGRPHRRAKRRQRLARPQPETAPDLRVQPDSNRPRGGPDRGAQPGMRRMIRVRPRRGLARGRRIACGARSGFRRVGQGLSLVIVYRFTPLLTQGPDCSLDIRVIPASPRLKAAKARIPGWAILRLSLGISAQKTGGGGAARPVPRPAGIVPRTHRRDVPEASRRRPWRDRPLSHAGQRDIGRPAGTWPGPWSGRIGGFAPALRWRSGRGTWAGLAPDRRR